VTVLVTGANGFVGRWVMRALVAAGHRVVAACGPGARPDLPGEVPVVALDLLDTGSVAEVAAGSFDAVIHLAGCASGADALRDPGMAWMVNAGGTARLLNALGLRRSLQETDPVVLVVSTAEVYGASPAPLTESAPVRPRSPYAASKVGAEVAAAEIAARTGLRVITVRAFPHTGPGQDTRFVAPAFAERLRIARQAGAPVVTVGNLEVTRDLLDVRDVAAAYVALLARGVPGETYNVASGTGIGLRDLFDRLADIVGVAAIPEADPAFLRPADLPVLVGDATKLRAATGWSPAITLDQTLRDLVDAQTH